MSSISRSVKPGGFLRVRALKLLDLLSPQRGKIDHDRDRANVTSCCLDVCVVLWYKKRVSEEYRSYLFGLSYSAASSSASWSFVDLRVSVDGAARCTHM